MGGVHGAGAVLGGVLDLGAEMTTKWTDIGAIQMAFEEWIKDQPDGYYSSAEIFKAGAASQDAEVAELVAALKPFGAIDLVESRLPAEFAMLILRARAAIAKVRKP